MGSDSFQMLFVAVGLSAGLGFVILLASLLLNPQIVTTSKTSEGSNTPLESNATSTTSFRAIAIIP
jgi:hypothetical protein